MATKQTKTKTKGATKPSRAATRAAAVDHQVEAASRGLGAIVWWDLDGTRITPVALRVALASTGIAVQVPDIDAISAAKRAAREWREHGVAGVPQRLRAEVVAEDATTLTVGVLQHERVGQAEVAWRQVDTATWDGAAWTAQPGPAARFAADARETQQYLDHAWIRPKLIQAELDRAGAFPLRRQGGIYFVPTTTLPIVEALQKAVATIGSSAIRISHVADSAASRDSVGSAARDSLTDSLGELRATIAAWRESARAVRQDSSDAALAAFASLKARADLYAESLGLALVDFVAEVDAAKADALQLVGDLAAAPKPEREPRDPNAASGPSKWSAAVRALYDAHVGPDGSAVVDAAAIRAAGLCETASTYTGFWNRDRAAAGSVSLSATATKRDGALRVMLRPLTQTATPIAQVAAPVEAEVEVPPVIDAVPTAAAPVTVEPDLSDDEAVADRREQLASMTRSELEHVYRRAVGRHAPARGAQGGAKAAVIDAILAAESDRVAT